MGGSVSGSASHSRLADGTKLPEDVSVDISSQIVAQGRLRDVYGVTVKAGKDSTALTAARFWDRVGEGYPAVIKVFKPGKPGGTLTNSIWAIDSSLLVYVEQVAEAFNTNLSTRSERTLPLHFAMPLLARTTNTPKSWLLWYQWDATALGPEDVLLVQPLLQGTYRVFLSNNGWHPGETKCDCDAVEEAQAFAHFSWVATKGAFLICDLQGVATDTELRLTDPAFHSDPSKTNRHPVSSTDLGTAGQRRFFFLHQCNRFCKALGIANSRPPVPPADPTLGAALSADGLSTDPTPAGASPAHSVPVDASAADSVPADSSFADPLAAEDALAADSVPADSSPADPLTAEALSANPSSANPLSHEPQSANPFPADPSHKDSDPLPGVAIDQHTTFSWDLPRVVSTRGSEHTEPPVDAA